MNTQIPREFIMLDQMWSKRFSNFLGQLWSINWTNISNTIDRPKLDWSSLNTGSIAERKKIIAAYLKTLSKFMQNLKEKFSELQKQQLNFFRNLLNNELVKLGFKSTQKNGYSLVGKDVEGFIPFITWPRGSIVSQLVKNLILPNKLSQLNRCTEISYGY